VISVVYDRILARKKVKPEEIKKPSKHIIHRAFEWKKMLDDGKVSSMSEIAKTAELPEDKATESKSQVVHQTHHML